MTMENQDRDAAIQQINACKAGFRAAKTRQEMETSAQGYKAGLKLLNNAIQYEKNKCKFMINGRIKS